MDINKSKMDQLNYEPSEGEEFLMDFFDWEGIDFIEQDVINNLKGDSCTYRVADFYLPKYKVYVEFFGMWNLNELKKSEYREKKKVYALNDIPCIYLYPENLGIIHYSFNKRMRVVLKKYNMKKELFKFNVKLLVENKGDSIVGFIFFLLLFILFQFDRKAEWFWQSCVVAGALSIYNAYGIVKGYMIFFKDEYSYVGFSRD